MQITLHESNLKRIVELLEQSGTSYDKLIANYIKRKMEAHQLQVSELDLDEIPF